MILGERAQFLVDNLDWAGATGVDDARPEVFQLKLWSDESTFRIENKSRQIAWSWALAADFLIDALLNKRDGIFVSISLEEAKEKIRYAKSIYEHLRIGGLPKLVRDAQFNLEFSNGARLTSLPSKPARGRARSNVGLDEFAHAQRDRAIYTGSLPVVSKGGRLRIGSSPLGASGVFWEVYTQSLRPYSGYKRRATPWWHVYAFCTNVPEALKMAPALTTAQMVERFGNERIQALFSNLPWEDFEQEYCHLPQTEVLLANGCSKRFIDLAIEDQLVYNDRGKLSVCTVRDFRRTGMRKIVKITTEAGTTLAASSDHRVKTRNGKESISEATEVGYVFGVPLKGAADLALARLVGYNLGDGTITERRNRYTKKGGEVSTYAPYYQASYYSSVRDDLERLADDLLLAGIATTRPNVLFKKGRKSEYDAYQIHIQRDSAQKLVDAGCVIGKKVEQDFPVPNWIRSGSRDIRIEFLAALFGAEGATPREKTGGTIRHKLPNTICLKMMKRDESFVFLDQVAEMLAELGIRTTVTSSRSNGKYACGVLVHTDLENAMAFFSTVGYRYARRKEEAAFLWRYYLLAYRHEAVVRKAEVAALRAQGLSYAKVAERLGISAQGAHNLVHKDIQRTVAFPFFSEWVAERYVDGTLYLKIISREDGGEEDVYNITVDSPDHSYLLADGLDNYNCTRYVDESTAWITWEEIKAAQDDNLECYMAKAIGSLTPEIGEAVEALAQAIAKGSVEGSLAVGVDIGRTRNTTEIYAVGLSTTNTYPLRLALTLDNIDFDDQLGVLLNVLQQLPVVSMKIDQNGIGRNLAENAAKRFPAKVQPENFTNETKRQWATDAKMLIQQGRTPLPVDKDIAYQIHSIKRMVTGSNNLVFDTDRNEKAHADKFWGWALALAGAITPTITALRQSRIVGRPTTSDIRKAVRRPN